MSKDQVRVFHHSFDLTTDEEDLLQRKMKASGVKKNAAFFRAMILKGFILKLDLSEIREIIRLLRNLTNNVNQIAKSLHEQGSIYETEIDDIQLRVSEIWNLLRKFLAWLERAEN